MATPETGSSRRTFLGAAGAIVTAAAGSVLAGCTPERTSSLPRADAGSAPAPSTPAQSGSTSTTTPTAPSVVVTPAPPGEAAAVSPTGPQQAGVTRPALPQSQLLVAVYGMTGRKRLEIRDLLADIGSTILTLTGGRSAQLAGLSPGDLTVTIGIGPAAVAAIDPALPGASALPAFAHEKLDPAGDGGDLVVQVSASDPLVVRGALQAVQAAAGRRLLERWRQRAARGPYQQITDTVAAPRNVLGFVDGIIGPHSETELAADVWLAAPSRAADGTLMVVRRMLIDVEDFTALSVREQEAVIGRRRDSAVPLSGGTSADAVDLQAKTADGRYVIPVDAHARRAHSLTVGVPLMLRRSYSMDEPAQGLLFVSFQNALHTFTATMARMSDADALLARTTTTATGTFLILPGFDAEHPLGAALFS